MSKIYKKKRVHRNDKKNFAVKWLLHFTLLSNQAVYVYIKNSRQKLK